MRLLLSTYGSPRGNVEPRLELVEGSLGFGAEARLCTPPDLAGLLAGVGMALTQIGGGR
jgi:UDP:flavonoid glycosyltransferase YjiC (YdhE family)